MVLDGTTALTPALSSENGMGNDRPHPGPLPQEREKHRQSRCFHIRAYLCQQGDSALEGGFTMVEIAICLAVIAFALVAIIGVLPIGMTAQKTNREETIINFDAHYLMDAIRSGSQGQDALTNYIISITNVSTIYSITGGRTNITAFTNWYNTAPNGLGQYWMEFSSGHNFPILTNGFQIIGLLTRPRYIYSVTGFTSNYTTADFRAITGSATDQGGSQASRDFAFRYRVTPEISQVRIADQSLTNYVAAIASNLPPEVVTARSNYFVLAANQQNNLAEIRLAFRWPVLPNGAAANGSQVFRTMASGMITNVSTNLPPKVGRYFFEPLTYGTNAPK